MSYPISDQVVNKLLDLLASDDRFRELFCMSPRIALAEAGHLPALDFSVKSGPWDCIPVAKLASKDVIRNTREQLRAQLSFVTYNPIGLGVAFPKVVSRTESDMYAVEVVHG